MRRTFSNRFESFKTCGAVSSALSFCLSILKIKKLDVFFPCQIELDESR